ncbi:Piso0_004785 [Millerozyma farinosa CBS 7064]|uniref:Piso0_004785 protein n=1 Tax=Pichia sorbitophila (strain ATCC MYA-4447 / BCRC 22081 / CBS 7064 / NBRC 10061 / NRRL Y-12695) TaxID=559304 RepID=G8Y3D5_PICSO|nr:Piso0_004785 [Millerozyma farinosa CBS 7064]
MSTRKSSTSGMVEQSPLSPIRISDNLENRWTERPKNKRSRKKHRDSGRKESMYGDEDRFKSQKYNDSFNFDLSFESDELPPSQHSAPHKDQPPKEETNSSVASCTSTSSLKDKGGDFNEDPNDIKKARQLVSIYLNTRNTMRADFNVVDPIADSTISGMEDNSSKGEDFFKVSRSTFTRAEKVKTTLSLKYLYIQKTYDWLIHNKDTNEHAGAEGVYNPLQVIRNRDTRYKGGEKRKRWTTNSLALASSAFSSHNIHNKSKKKWTSVWEVDIFELIYDMTWRNSHRHELRRPDGSLWFPELSKSFHKHHQKNDPKRLHDRLFNDNDDGRPATSNMDTSGMAHNSSDQLFNMLKGRTKKHKKRPSARKDSFNSFHSSQSSMSYDRLLTDDQQKSSTSTSLRNTISPVLESASDIQKEDDPNFKLTFDVKRQSHENSLSESVQEANNVKLEKELDPKEFNITSVPFRPIESKKTSNPPSTATSESKSYFNTPDLRNYSKDINKQDFIYDHYRSIIIDLKYFNQVLSNRLFYLRTIHPALCSSLENKLNDIIYHQIKDMRELVVHIDGDFLSAYESLYNGFLDEIRSSIHVINDEYSVRVDNLMSNSDRSIGEITTSLSLELRKTNERLEKLNSSLFGSIVNETLSDSSLSIKIMDSGSNRILYFFLENVIVVLLRTTWIVANTYRVFRGIIRILWKIFYVFIRLLVKTVTS